MPSIREIKAILTLERSDSRRKEPVYHVRTLRLPVPARDGKLLLKLLRLDLEAHPPSAPVAAVSMLTTPARAPSQQLGVFLPLSPDPERLEISLARIQNKIGRASCR